MANQTIVLTGIAIDKETATVTIRPRMPHADGMNIALSVKLLEYVFEVETFFYGYNCSLFLKEAEELLSARTDRAQLFNYDGTLTLEFIRQAGVDFMSFRYKSVLPQPPERDLLKSLRNASRLDTAGDIGSSFSFRFMPMHNPVSEVADWLTELLAAHPVSRASPYPHR